MVTFGIVLAWVLIPTRKPQPCNVSVLPCTEKRSKSTPGWLQAQIIPTYYTCLAIAFIMILEQPTNTSPTGAKCQHNLPLIGDLVAELKVHKVFMTRNKPSPHHPPHFPLHHPTHTHPPTHPHTHTRTHTHTHTEALIFFKSLFKIWGWILFSIYFTRVSTLSGTVRNFRNIGKMSGKFSIFLIFQENFEEMSGIFGFV